MENTDWLTDLLWDSRIEGPETTRVRFSDKKVSVGTFTRYRTAGATANMTAGCVTRGDLLRVWIHDDNA